MADAQNGPELPKKKGFKRVTKSYKVQGGARRERAAVTVNLHGLTTGNAAATEMLIGHAIIRGVNPKGDFMIDMGTDDEREVVAVWPTAEASPGTSTIRIYKRGASCAFHIGAALDQSPALRPTAKKTRCLVFEELDEFDLPVMIIPIKAGKAVNAQSRDDDPSTSDPEAAAGDE